MKRYLLILLSLFILLIAPGCTKKAEADPIDDNYRVFYQIFVGSFSDSNGDGTGDLQGIINRMDYLNDGNINSSSSLGVQGIWLSPIFTSPTYHKYDVKNYYEIDPKFGTMDDLKALVDLCHERNVKVILDLPINHTSNQNQWFIKFKNAQAINDATDKYYDFYTYVTGDTKLPGHTYYAIGSGSLNYYEGNFGSDMPELNFDNPDVYTECVNIAKYYLDMGIDGFRFDAAKYIYFNDTNKSVAFWKKYMADLKAINPDIYTVGEVWSNDNETLSYISALNCFNFQSSGSDGVIAQAVKNGKVASYCSYVEYYQGRVQEASSDAMVMPFISNHDMDRSAGYLYVSQYQAQMAANLLILSSGSPFIYYGEEIGLRGSRGSANTDANRRLAMLWGDEDSVTNPVGSTYADDKQINGTVASQLKDKNSLFNHYRKLIDIRNKYPEIARGSYKAINFNKDSLGGFIVSLDDSKVIIIHNADTESITIDLNNYLNVDYSKLEEYIGLGKAKLKGSTLTIDGLTSVIIK